MPVAHGDHRLYGQRHSRLQAHAASGAAKVGDGRILVHLFADAVSAQIADDAVALGFGVCLHGVGDVAQAVAGAGLIGPQPEALFRIADELFRLGVCLAHGRGEGAVGLPAVQDYAAVHGEYLSFLEAVFRGKAVHDLVVHGCADGEGKALIALERGDGAGVADQFLGHAVEFQRGNAGLDGGAERAEHIVQERSRGAHLLDLGRGFDGDHRATPGRRGCSRALPRARSRRRRS